MIITELEENHYKDFLSLNSRFGHSIYEDLSYISKNEALLYEANQSLESCRKGDVKIWIALDDDKVSGSVAYCLRDWDTKHFGFEIGGILHIITEKSGLERDSLLQEALLTTAVQDLQDLGIKCIVCRISSKETSLIHTLERNGFLLMDELLTFFADTSHSRIRKVSIRVGPCKESEVKNLVEIAFDGFRTGHFFADDRFPLERSHQLYGKWIENACYGPVGEVLVAHLDRRPVGFIVCRKDESASDFLQTFIGIIDLIAVSRDYRCQGIGYDLMTSAVTWFGSNQICLARIGTHLTNLAGIRLSLNTGFQYAASELTFHMWV